MSPGALVRLLRPFTWAAPVGGVASGSLAAAFALDVRWPPYAVGLAAGAAVAATASSNAWNQVFDVTVDRVSHPERPLPAGEISARAALALGDVLAGVAVVLAALVSSVFLACVAVGVLASWIYSAPPLRLKRSTFGSLLSIAIPRGLLVPVAGWAVVAEPVRADPWALGVVAALFVFGGAATKDFADVPGDSAGGCRTLPIVWGPRRASVFVAPFLVLPFLLYPVLGALGWIDVPVSRLVVLGLFLAALGAITARGLLREAKREEPSSSRRAWRGMYVLFVASQVGVVLAYAL